MKKSEDNKRWEILAPVRLYGIIDLAYVAADDAVVAAEQLIDGGVGVLQLRAKNVSKAEISDLAKLLLPLARKKNVPLVINDFLDVAAEVGADGVHLGQDDASIATARAALGGGALIGRSTHSLAQAQLAQEEGADYIGFGPLFATPTKPGRAAIGLENVAVVHEVVKIPIFCIGGIKAENLVAVRAAGAQRVCVVSELLQAKNRRERAQGYLENL